MDTSRDSWRIFGGRFQPYMTDMYVGDLATECLVVFEAASSLRTDLDEFRVTKSVTVRANRLFRCVHETLDLALEAITTKNYIRQFALMMMK